MKNNNLKIFLNGIIMENPALVLVLGTCPTLAITTKVSNAVGMGLAFFFVLLLSNLVISLIRKLVPNEIRIPTYIVIIATLVTIAQMLLQAFLPAIDQSLGAFVALIVVNCIILGRAEAFASQNNPGKSIIDAVGMSLGFFLALFLIAFIREFFGAGTITLWEGICIDLTCIFDFFRIAPFAVLSNSTVGGFLVYGTIIGVVVAVKSAIETKKAEKAKKAVEGGRE